MAISKLNKRLIFTSIIIILLISYTCNNLYMKQQKYEQNIDAEVKNCKEGLFVAENYYKISFYQYDLKELINMQIYVLHKGKVIKRFYRENKIDDFFSFKFNNLMKSDSLVVKVKNDIYYIHSFKNEFPTEGKPRNCYLNSYKINNVIISGVRPEGFFLRKEYLD